VVLVGALLLLLELGLFVLAPRLLARLAFVPAGLDRRIPLDDELARALTRELEGGDYRQPPVPVLEEARLARALGAGMVGFVDGDAGLGRGATWLRVARGGRFWMGRPFLVAHIRPRLAGKEIAIRVRVLPVPVVSFAALAALCLDVPFDVREALFLAVVVGAFGAVNVLWNRALVRSVVDEVARRLLSREAAPAEPGPSAH
jgi:hypothetical protein